MKNIEVPYWVNNAGQADQAPNKQL